MRRARDPRPQRKWASAGWRRTAHGRRPRVEPGPFPAAICISPNDMVVHGIPGKRVIKDGDIVSVDVGAIVDEYYGDGARTFADLYLVKSAIRFFLENEFAPVIGDVDEGGCEFHQGVQMLIDAVDGFPFQRGQYLEGDEGVAGILDVFGHFHFEAVMACKLT